MHILKPRYHLPGCIFYVEPEVLAASGLSVYQFINDRSGVQVQYGLSGIMYVFKNSPKALKLNKNELESNGIHLSQETIDIYGVMVPESIIVD